MGAKLPTEYNGATCGKCGRNLPPARSFDDIQNTYIDGRPVYIFNYGQYYRWRGSDCYQCPDCFFKPKRDEEERLRKEAAKKLEKEEEERLRKEAAEKLEKEEKAKKKLEEQEMRDAALELANQNTQKLEQLSTEWHHQNQAKSINRDMQQNMASKFTVDFTEDDEETNMNARDNPFYHFYYLFSELYGYELDYLDLGDLTADRITDLIEPLQELIQEEWLSQSAPHIDLVTSTQLFMLKIYLAKMKLPSTKYLTTESQLIFLFQQLSGSSESIQELLYLTLSLLVTVQGSNDSLALEKTSISHLCMQLEAKNTDLDEYNFISQIDTFSLDFLESLLLNSIRTFPESKEHPIISNITTQLVSGSLAIFEYSDCSLKDSFTQLVRNESWDPKSIWIVLCGILRQCYSIKDEIINYCQLFHLINTYRIDPNQILEGQVTLLDSITTLKADILYRKVKSFADTEKDKIKEFNILLEEIDKSKLVDNATLESVRTIVDKAKSRLQKYGYPTHLDTKEAEDILSTSAIQNWKAKVQIAKGRTATFDILEESLALLSCVVNKINGWWPRDTQLICWSLLMLSTDSGHLLQMNTGEGKSCVVSMLAAMLSCQGQYVDIITSSPILALRDAKEWIEFYDTFGLHVSNNIESKDDNSRSITYRANIVYGTVANFASDILRQEFNMKDVRPNRTFDSIIVDEVDSMLLDQGVQFTYLSHETPGLDHLNPVLAMVWCSVSQFLPLGWGSEVFWCATPQPFF